MNVIFYCFILFSFLMSGAHQLGLFSASQPEAMTHLSHAMLDSASQAVTLSISLMGGMCLFLGLMKVAEAG
ncbi:MAG: spore maturation protein, partial [Pseudomonadota bacterium]